MDKAELFMHKSDAVTNPEVVPAVFCQFRRVRRLRPVRGMTVGVEDSSLVNVLLQHIHDRLMLFRLAVIDHGDAGVTVNEAPGPLELGESSKVTPALPPNQGLINGNGTFDFEIGLHSDLDVVAQRIPDHLEVGGGGDITRELLRDSDRGPLNPKDNRLVEGADIEASHGRTRGDMFLSKAEIADPEIVVFGLVKAVFEGHLFVAEVAGAAVVDKSGGHPIVDDLDLGP